MSCAIKTGADGKPSALRISYSIDAFGSVANQNFAFQIYLDGNPIGHSIDVTSPVIGGAITLSDIIKISVSPGTHKVDLYWLTVSGTVTANAGRRTLLVEET